jgi:hypothetical protein
LRAPLPSTIADGWSRRPPRRMAVHHRKQREFRPVADELSSAATSEIGAKTDMAHLSDIASLGLGLVLVLRSTAKPVQIG